MVVKRWPEHYDERDDQEKQKPAAILVFGVSSSHGVNSFVARCGDAICKSRNNQYKAVDQGLGPIAGWQITRRYLEL